MYIHANNEYIYAPDMIQARYWGLGFGCLQTCSGAFRASRS